MKLQTIIKEINELAKCESCSEYNELRNYKLRNKTKNESIIVCDDCLKLYNGEMN